MTTQGIQGRELSPSSLINKVFHSVCTSNARDLHIQRHGFHLPHGQEIRTKDTQQNHPETTAVEKKGFKVPAKKAKSWPSSTAGYDIFISLITVNISGEIIPTVSQELLPLSFIMFSVAAYGSGNTINPSHFSIVPKRAQKPDIFPC